MKPKFQIIRLNLFRAAFTFCIILTLLNSCTKIEIKANDDSATIEETTNRFFKTPPNTDQIVLKVLEEIKSRNNKKEFVSYFGNNIGFPV